MKELVLKLPASVEVDEKELLLILVFELYQKKKISLGQAAEILNISVQSAMDLLGLYGYSVFGQDEEEFLKDLQQI